MFWVMFFPFNEPVVVEPDACLSAAAGLPQDVTPFLLANP